MVAEKLHAFVRLECQVVMAHMVTGSDLLVFLVLRVHPLARYHTNPSILRGLFYRETNTRPTTQELPLFGRTHPNSSNFLKAHKQIGWIPANVWLGHHGSNMKGAE